MASVRDEKEHETIKVSSNIYLHIEKDGYGNFYVYSNEGRGFLLNGTTAKDLLKYLYHSDQIDLVNEILNTLSTALNAEVVN